jgi:chromosome segregation ATPase
MENFMEGNKQLISVIAMMISVFFAGAFLNGERLRTKELEMELKEIRAQKDLVMQRVEQINQKTYEDEKRILARIDTAYSLLNSLNTQRALKSDEIRKIRDRIAQTQKNIEGNIAIINAQTEAGFGLIDLPADTARTPSETGDQR